MIWKDKPDILDLDTGRKRTATTETQRWIVSRYGPIYTRSAMMTADGLTVHVASVPLYSSVEIGIGVTLDVAVENLRSGITSQSRVRPSPR